MQPDADGLTRTGYATFDGGRAARVAFDDTPAAPLGDAGADQSDVIARDASHGAQIAYGHESVGAMETALRTTTEYLKTRKQFGVPLKTFQALTFRAADMYVSLELARSTVALGDAGAARRRRLDERRSSRRHRAPSCRSAGPAGTSARRRSSCTAASA